LLSLAYNVGGASSIYGYEEGDEEGLRGDGGAGLGPECAGPETLPMETLPGAQMRKLPSGHDAL